MIWMDSNFAIDWMEKNQRIMIYFDRDMINLAKLALTPFQYIEILAFFQKRSMLDAATQKLQDIPLSHPDRHELSLAAELYVKARKEKSKASYADAVLAAMAISRDDKILTFDEDFKTLGFHKVSGFWYPKK